MQDDEASGAGIPARAQSLLDLIDRLREEFPRVSAHSVVRCVSIVAHQPSSAALPVDVLLRRTERIARARLAHLSELPVPPVGLDEAVVPLPEPRGGQVPADTR
ncbi:MAG: hypothetical protein ACXV3V_12260 [Actinomycetes bacterium]